MGDNATSLSSFFPPVPGPGGDSPTTSTDCCECQCGTGGGGSMRQFFCPCRGKGDPRYDPDDHRAHHREGGEGGSVEDLQPLLTSRRRRARLPKPEHLQTCKMYGLVMAVWVVVILVYASFIMLNVVPGFTKKNLLGKPDDLTLQPAELWAEIVALHIFLVLFVVCYFYAMLLPPGSPDDRWRWKEGTHYPDFLNFVPPIVKDPFLCREMKVFRPQKAMTQERKMEQQLEKRTNVLRYRHCWHCEVFKPDRTHHCRMMQRCVLRMDHYCPWINNTLGFDNMKFFILVLFYAQTALLLYLASMLPRFLQAQHLRHPSQDWILLVLYPLVIFLFIVVAWFFGFHCHLIVEGYTTVEWCEKRAMKGQASDIILDEHDDACKEVDGEHATVQRTVVEASALYHESPWKVSLLDNVRQIMGKNVWLWLVPVSHCCGSAPGGAPGSSARGTLYNDSLHGDSPYTQGIDFPRNPNHQLFDLRQRVRQHEQRKRQQQDGMP
eukprot:INCI6290.2.p1 GENE.INCI6290.2~~INCI6290.2.p1  ORF type:complete len:517 (-),score=86.47 INCI6290.2:1181-2659(-)